MSPAVHALLQRAAEIEGRTLTDFVISVASEAARKTITTTDLINLSVQDQRRLVDVLLNPPVPAPALVRAAKVYDRLVEQP